MKVVNSTSSLGNLRLGESTLVVYSPDRKNMQTSSTKPVANDTTIEELGIVIGARDLSPTIMSQDFLKFSGIIPSAWELAQEPILNASSAYLSYTNGVNISAQPRSFTLGEALNNKEIQDIMIGKVATRYVNKLPHADYIGMSFTPKMLVPFPDDQNAAQNYISERLLAPGSWKKIGIEPVQAGINLMYRLERCHLTISIAEARLQHPEQEVMNALLFSGSFNYNLSPDLAPNEKLKQLREYINSWPQDLNNFRDLIQDEFLAKHKMADPLQAKSLFPSL